MKETKPHNGHTNDPLLYPQNCDTRPDIPGKHRTGCRTADILGDDVLFLRRNRGIIGIVHSATHVEGDQIRTNGMSETTRIEIVYCRQCRWLLRAAWMAQELLTTFEEELTEVALRPGTGGVFEVRVGDLLIWSRKEKGRFPDIPELKQLVRDRVAPRRSLGHSDRQNS